MSYRPPLQYIMVIVALRVLLLGQNLAIAVQWVRPIVVVHELAIVHVLVLQLCIVDGHAAYLCAPVEVFAILNLDDLFDPTDAEITFKFKLTLLVELLYFQFPRVQILEKEFAAGPFFEKVSNGSIEKLLNNIKPVRRMIIEERLIDAPVIELQFQHLEITLLNLVQLPAISDKV